MPRCSKVYKVDSETIKCVSGETVEDIKHSEYCLKEKELREKYPNAAKVAWDAEKQIWSINFSEMANESKVNQNKEELVEEDENDDEWK